MTLRSPHARKGVLSGQYSERPDRQKCAYSPTEACGTILVFPVHT